MKPRRGCGILPAEESLGEDTEPDQDRKRSREFVLEACKFKYRPGEWVWVPLEGVRQGLKLARNLGGTAIFVGTRKMH